MSKNHNGKYNNVFPRREYNNNINNNDERSIHIIPFGTIIVQNIVFRIPNLIQRIKCII